MASQMRNFMGAKLVLFVGSRILSLQRDEAPGLLWPGYWDLPGGGREGDESPLACVLRETQEEFSITVPRSQITWGRAYTNSIGKDVWFFAGILPDALYPKIRLGEEGQGWDLFLPSAYIQNEKAVPQFRHRLADYLAGVSGECYT